VTLDLGWWDLALIVVVSLQGTLLAYLPAPKWKAFLVSLPVPFTLSSLALGKPVSAQNVLGLVLLLFFALAVRWLHQGARLHITAAIALAALGYCGSGTLLVGVVPETPLMFWLSALGVIGLGIWLLITMPHRKEPDYRSPLPVWLKLPVMMGVILFIVVIKEALQGFMTVFPMMTTVGAYESRRSLWTLVRQMPVVMVTLTPMMIACRLSQPWVGQGLSLVVGWAVFLSIFLPLTRYLWSRAAAEAQADLLLSAEKVV